MENLTIRLIDTTWDDIEVGTIEAAKKVLLDTIGALLAGMKETSTKKLIGQLQLLQPGSYSVLGTSTTLDLHAAAFVNGTATVAIELDEGNQWSKGHPAAHVVPSMLTYVQTKENYSGKQFILNLIKAYEACSQFGRATTLLPNAHAHGTWGVMGAAASVLFIENVSQKDFVSGLNISASFALPTMWNSALEGALIRNSYVGQAAESGIKTVSLLKSGFYAPKNNIEYIYNDVIGSDFSTAAFTDPSDGWDIERNYFKNHAFCRYAHAPLEAFQTIIMEHKIIPDDIKSIEVHTYQRASTLKSSDYHNPLSAKFSIPFVLSAWLYTKTSAHEVFSEDILKRQDIREMARKVSVSASEELEKNYPTIMPAEVTITLLSGDVYKKRLDNANGGPDEQLGMDRLIEKFKANTSGLLPDKKRDEIISWILHIEQQQNVGELISLLRQ